MVLAMERRDPQKPLPAALAWSAPAETLKGLTAGECASVAAWLDGDAYARAHPRLQAWARRGWFSVASAWCRARLAERGIAVTGEAAQVKHWFIAAILRVPTERGAAWFKAVPTIFAHECSLLALIGPSMPEHLPRVIATDPARGWTLMDAIPALTLRERPEQAEEAAALLARLHITWAGRERELFGAGCADRRLGTLQPGLAAILAREDVTSRFSAAECARLDAFCASIPARVEALSACGMPDTLIHGDFHRGNVATGSAAPVIFDWTDGCISHPLFDLATFLPDDDPVERAARLHAYFAPWTRRLDEAVLDRAWAIAEPLAYVHHAISYMRIMDATDPADLWEFDSDPLFWLRWLHDIASDSA